MTPPTTDHLAGLLKCKHSYLAQLHRLSIQQLQLVDGGEMDQLIRVLAAKQRLLQSIESTQRELAPFGEQDPADRIWRSAELRHRCSQLVEECQQLFTEIVRLEKESETRLRKRRRDTAATLEGMHLAERARGAYTSRPATAPSRIDLASDPGETP